MSAVESITVTMPVDLAAAVRQAVARGGYASTSDVVREALRDWAVRQNDEQRERDGLRDTIRAGLDSGPPIPVGEVFAELRARYADRA